MGVQAIDNGKRASAFATSRFVPGTSGVSKKKEDGTNVTVRSGHIAYQTLQPAMLTLYDTRGAILTHTRVSGNGMLPWQLPHGVYIARLANQAFTIVN